MKGYENLLKGFEWGLQYVKSQYYYRGYFVDVIY